MAQYGVPNSEDPKKRVTNPFSYENLFHKNFVDLGPRALNILGFGFIALMASSLEVPRAAQYFGGFFIIFSLTFIVAQLDQIISALRTANQIAASASNK